MAITLALKEMEQEEIVARFGALASRWRAETGMLSSSSARNAPCLPADHWHGSCRASPLVTGIGASPGRLVLGFEGHFRRGPRSSGSSWKACGDGQRLAAMGS